MCSAMERLLFMLVIVLSTQPIAAIPTRDELIQGYFEQGYDYHLILCFLFVVHGIAISIRQLKRVLRRLGLRRRPYRTTLSFHRACKAIEAELRGPGSMLGYRGLLQRLRLKHPEIPISRDMVMMTLRVLDPGGVKMRKSHKLRRRKYRCKGPNYLWHCDNYDKLSPYGFAIHGCIDGYSRRIMWLEVGASNKNSAIIAGHYLKCVKEIGGVPRILRCDLGTENARLAYLHPFLRRNGRDCFAGESSFLYGKSTSNQRIEAWWSVLRKWNSEWWMDFFKGLKDIGAYNETNLLHVDCLRLCFMHIIEKELKLVARQWNTHKIRRSRLADTPPGIPDKLYFMPQLGGAMDYLERIRSDDICYIEHHCTPPDPPVSLELLKIVDELLSEQELMLPSSIEEALQLYLCLTDALDMSST